MSIDYLRGQRRSALIETTLRQPGVVRETMAGFQRAGYRTELHVVAVPLEVSRLGTVSRYVGQVEESGAGRWTPTAAHDTAAAAVPGTVAVLVGSGVVDHVSIENRQGEPYYRANPPLRRSMPRGRPCVRGRTAGSRAKHAAGRTTHHAATDKPSERRRMSAATAPTAPSRHTCGLKSPPLGAGSRRKSMASWRSGKQAAVYVTV